MSDSSSSVNPLDALAEDFVARYRRGENPSVSEYAAKYPELADDVRDLFPGLLLIEDVRPEAGEATGPFTPVAAPSGLEHLGDYRILRQVGHGGMGIVYEAEQVSLGRHVALKVLPAAGLRKPTFLERFHREAKAAARLHHTNIVPVFGVGEADGVHFYAMQFINGQSLDEVLSDVRRLRKHAGTEAGVDDSPRTIPESSVAQGLLMGQFEMLLVAGPDKSQPRTVTAQPPTPAEPKSAPGLSAGGSEAQYFRSVARVGVQAADALAHAHRQGILHRDIKPSNLLLDQQGTVWIIDFGLAKAEDEDELTHTGDIVGTPRFMAPERFDDQSLPQSDVYSLGLTLYEMLTLRPAFHDANPARLVEKVLHELPVPPRKIDPHIPRDLETIVLTCLAKDPAGRYATAEKLAEDLRCFLADRPIWARRARLVERLRRWGRRNPALAAAGGLTASLLVVTTVVSVGWATHSSRLADDIQRAWRESEHIQRAWSESQRAWSESESALAAHKAQVLYERGEIGQGLLWTARSLETAPEGTEDLCRDLRAILAGWRSRLFPLTGCYSVTDEILAFGPEDSIVWAAEPGGSVYRWNIKKSERDGQPLSPKSKITAVTVSRAGDFILTAEDRVARLWEIGTGKRGLTFHPPGWLDAVAFSQDGRTVLTADHVPTDHGYDTTIRRWEAHTGKPLVPTYYYAGSVSALALSPDGRLLLAVAQRGGDEAICSWDVVTGKSLPPLPVPRGGYLALAFSPDGKALLTGSRDQTARLWDAATGRPLGPPLYHSAPVRLVAFSRDGRTLLTADARRTVRTWAVENGPSPAQVFVHHQEVRTVAISPDGQTLATGCFDGKVRLWHTGRGAKPKELPHGDGHPISTILFSPDGQTLLTADWRGVARLWHTDSGRPKGKPLQHGSPRLVEALAFSGTSRWVATGGFDGTARIWDAATGAFRAKFPHGDGVVAVAFDPTETRLLTGSTDGTAQVWNIATGQPLGGPLQHGGTVRAVAFSPEGERVLTASMDGTARLWDAVTGQPLGPPMVHGGAVWVAAFSPDGRRIATGSWDGTAQLWDAATSQPRGQPLAHDDEVRTVAFSPDSRWVVTGSLDGTARLWDAATGRPLGPRLPHSARVWAVAFGATGRMVLTGCEDGKARLWQIPPPLEGQVERIVLWAQVRTGMELAPDGEVRALDPPAWKQRQYRLEELGGPPAP